MARKKKHEEHVNAEAWAIPYGDLVTLLLALFVVLYSMSSVNEGKFRVLSDSLVAAFRGTPKSVTPINIGEKAAGKGGDKQATGIAPTVLMKLPKKDDKKADAQASKTGTQGPDAVTALVRMEHEVRDAMQSLIDANLVAVRQEKTWLEVEIKTDILFPSGSSGFVAQATPVIDKLAAILKPFPNPLRVEGHTDDRPIHTKEFPSNWELSAARAASIVHHFTEQGVDPTRMEIVGLGEHHPHADNKTSDGRNANRRVVIVILQASEPGDVMTARRNAGADPIAPSSQTETAETASAANRFMLRVPAESLTAPAPADKTVLAQPPAQVAKP